MRRNSIAALCLLALSGMSLVAHAADHGDGTQATTTVDATADITDLFSWMSADKMKVYLVMDVNNNATATTKFSNVVKYVFHISQKGLLMANTDALQVICQFDAAQKISCWVQDVVGMKTLDYVTGDASATAGLVSTSTKLKVFAGLRDDPFFFNIQGFRKTVADAAAAYPGLMKDANGCAKGASAVAPELSKNMTGGAPANDFAKGGAVNTSGNILAIVIAADAALISGGAANIGVWASTNK